MGNATTWAIFFGVTFSSITLIIYALVGKVRSIVIAIPLAAILCFTVYVIISTHRIPNPRLLTIFWLVGSALGLRRQCFRKRSPDELEVP